MSSNKKLVILNRLRVSLVNQAMSQLNQVMGRLVFFLMHNNNNNNNNNNN